MQLEDYKNMVDLAVYRPTISGTQTVLDGVDTTEPT